MEYCVNIEVSNGEFLDKISILEIKMKLIANDKQKKNIEKEYYYLLEQMNGLLDSKKIRELYQELKSVNQKLWNIEDAVRFKEKHQTFDDEFIDLARNVYKTNDHRSKIKKKINQISESNFTEEKSYESY